MSLVGIRDGGHQTWGIRGRGVRGKVAIFIKEGFLMEMVFSAVAPARLYGLVLKLRPVEGGALMAFSGELVHGAWLDWIRRMAPDVGAMLHDGNKRRLFTCSS